MSVTYEQTFTVDSRDVDLTGCARPSAILGYLQEAATMAALRLGVSGPETLKKYNCFWMVVRIWVHLDRPLRWNERFTVRTWHRGAKGASTYRDFDLICDGVTVGEAVSTWVLADRDTYKLLRMSRLEEFQGTDGGPLCKARTLHRVRMPEVMTGREDRALHYSDTDINGHVNNIKYADFACDALHLEDKLSGRFIQELQIGYLDQCHAGETITVETAAQDDVLYARGVGPGGAERFDCALTLAPLPSEAEGT